VADGRGGQGGQALWPEVGTGDARFKFLEQHRVGEGAQLASRSQEREEGLVLDEPYGGLSFPAHVFNSLGVLGTLDVLCHPPGLEGVT
jgi:hypothetical protein